MCSSQENSTQHLLLIPTIEAFDSHTYTHTHTLTLLHVLQMCDVQIHTSDDNDVDFGFFVLWLGVHKGLTFMFLETLPTLVKKETRQTAQRVSILTALKSYNLWHEWLKLILSWYCWAGWKQNGREDCMNSLLSGCVTLYVAFLCWKDGETSWIIFDENNPHAYKVPVTDSYHLLQY